MRDEAGQRAEPGGSLGVRPLARPTRTEIEQLAHVFDRYRAHYGETADAGRTVTWLEENLRDDRIQAFVAEENGEVIGFAITMAVPASLKLGHFWQIRDLFVLPSRRRVGVGRALLDCIRAAALGAGASRLVLQTEADNTPALRLYAQNGYRAVGGYCSLTLPLQPPDAPVKAL